MASKVEIKLWTLHKNQQYIMDNAKRFNVVNAGRRFGKNIIIENLMVMEALKGHRVAYAEPSYGMSKDIWENIIETLKPVIAKLDNQGRRIELVTGGTIHFYTLINANSIRGKKYHLFCLNEAAFARNLEDTWEAVIRPTLIDYQGSAWFFSTPNGYNYFHALSEMPSLDSDYAYFHFTGYDNPLLPEGEMEKMKKGRSILKYRQEVLAEFVAGAEQKMYREYLQFYNDNTDIGKCETILGVDLAISQKTSADWTSIAVINKNKSTGLIYITSIKRFKEPFSTILKNIEAIGNYHNPHMIAIESVQAQEWAVQEMKRLTNLRIVGVRPVGDKVARFENLLSRFEQGLVYIHEDLKDSPFIKELLNFPNDEHDDMVDSVTTAFNASETVAKKESTILAF